MTKAKTQQPADKVAEMYSTMVEQAIRTNKVVSGGMERCVQEQMSLVEAAMESIRPLAEAKKPADMLSVQMEAFKAMNARMAETAANMMKIQQETGAELKDMMLENVKTITESMPKAA